MKRILLLITLFALNVTVYAQTETEDIRNTLLDYIEGTADGDAERLKRAFHTELNLYSINNGELRTLSGETYISYFEDGRERNRIGSILSIDYVNDAASAKIEVIMPERKRIYTDYLLLLKIDGAWKIIHKSYTFEEYEED